MAKQKQKKQKRKSKKKEQPAVRTFKIDNPVWAYCLFVRVGGTVDQANKFFDKKFGTDFATDPRYSSERSNPAARVYTKQGEKSHMIWFQEPPGIGLISHEAQHSVFHALITSGLPPSEEAQEAYAYLIEWTTKEITWKLYPDA